MEPTTIKPKKKISVELISKKKPKQPKEPEILEKEPEILEIPAMEEEEHVKPVWFLDRPIEEYSMNESGTYTDDKETYILPHSRLFPDWITRRFIDYQINEETIMKCTVDDDKKEKELFSHQKFIRDYMAPHMPYRGILLDHDLGSGKTRTAITVAEQYRKMGVKVLVLLPATLKPTWIEEIKLWGNEDVKKPKNYKLLSEAERRAYDIRVLSAIEKGYDFVSYNASNTIAQLRKAIGKQLVHRLVIVDEVHNLISMMVNTGSKGSKLYQSLMDVVDCKFLFLSATPLLNHSFELGIMFNILKGYMTSKRSKLFPDNPDAFEALFVNSIVNRMKNKEMFKKRIVGMVSYYFGGEGEIFPKVEHSVPIDVVFQKEQFSVYKSISTEELEKDRKKKDKSGKLADLSKTEGQKSEEDTVSSTFRVFSRRICNFVFPPQLKRPMPHPKIYTTKLNADPDKWTIPQKKKIQIGRASCRERV